MSVDATHLMELVAKRDAKRQAAREASDAAAKLDKRIREICPHAMTVKKESWFEDEWARTTYTTQWDECTVCGEKLNKRETSKTQPGI